ncbi:MAG: hypothetical protein K1X65_13800 [Caldilineales bacterium]|nr:hypothetical protein [Caldilineales bacterium]
MKMKTLMNCLFALCLVIVGVSGPDPVTAGMNTDGQVVGPGVPYGSSDIQLAVILAEDSYRPVYVPPPAEWKVTAAGVNALNFRVNYNPASCEGALAPWSADARAAFDFAASIWSSLLEGSVPVTIDACWRTDMDARILGSARPTTFWAWWDSGPALLETWHPIALANQIERQDLNGADAEIYAQFNSTFNWYFGTDGHPGDRYDFVSVVLHEIGHSLGFTDSMRRDDGAGNAECTGVANVGCWGYLNPVTQTIYPTYYDRLIENGSGQGLVSAFANSSTALGSQLISDNLWLAGANARAVQAGLRPKLYAPTSFAPGSSVSHLDQNTFRNTTDALMTPARARGEAIHHPGEITLGLFRDMNWLPVYVDANFIGVEFGSDTHPYNTVNEGANAAAVSGVLMIRTGNYRGTVYITKAMMLKSTGGLVTIGQ